ncbi:hypothetical protein KP509_11G052500 [Ceratopteris richardii]|uniref:Uncharacterized protein n=1 Tax=Ceratopteris richardii TaxID=49495 RepID=A0A8T2TPV7_CERRI|nr:hypothetical protein KP509_11G052500 [Ceratopteris richardii]KAH7425407.1 hypothetical protein KP509_11G052500 [Ceratopteris richardii]KAH7425408.1 hypothetical protein KP509_11G052500 [Ceratopteris richardii]
MYIDASGLWLGSPQPDSNDEQWKPPENWFGNIQYLINISVIGAFCCLVFFCVVKLKSDHKLPGAASLVTKLLSVRQATGQQVARLSGANASQYLATEGYSFIGFFVISLIALIVILPVNLYGGTVPLQDQFSRSTVIHLSKGSPLLWCHCVFMVAVVGVMHMCIQALYTRLSSTQFNGEASPEFVSSFTLMIHGIPRSLASNKRPLQEYLEHRYPGKVYRVIVPPDLSTFHSLKKNLSKKRKKLDVLLAREQSRVFTVDEEDDDLLVDYKEGVSGFVDLAAVRRRQMTGLRQAWRLSKSVFRQVWVRLLMCIKCGEEDAIAELQFKCSELVRELLPYKDGTAQGAGLAFVVFKDLHTASRALQDIRSWTRVGVKSAVMECELARSKWKAERAPPARDIYWHHVGSHTLSRCLRRIFVNTLLMLLLFFCSSPVAAFTALHSAGRLINPEAIDNVKVWLSWVQSSSWVAAIVLQFLPNVLMFVSMYFVVPTVLIYLSSFESHLTLSGEQRAALVKTVIFFLVNLIFLRGLLETSLEAAILHMRHCYEEGTGCEQIKQYMSSSFLANSCLSATAFLITSAFLGISYDLLAPIPWIKRKLQKLKHQRSENIIAEGALTPLDYDGVITEASLHEQLLPEAGSLCPGSVLTGMESSFVSESQGMDLLVCSLSREIEQQQQAGFDYAQYYAFNLTIFALALIYSSFVPTIVPIAAFYFGYRYIVDKYNFLFMYRARGSVATNDGKLLGTVIRVMKICIVLYIFAMLYFFYVRGDQERFQFLCTLAVAVSVCGKYGIERLFYPHKDGFSFEGGLSSIDSFVNGFVEYEVYSQPNFDWDTPNAGDV